MKRPQGPDLQPVEGENQKNKAAFLGPLDVNMQLFPSNEGATLLQGKSFYFPQRSSLKRSTSSEANVLLNYNFVQQ